MRKLTALLFVAITFSVASAQPPGERGGPGGDRQPLNAVLVAIDANGDHEITTDEMKNAFAALQKLDANKNGKLDRAEIYPEMAGGPGGQRGHRDFGGGGGVDARQSVVKRLRGFDKNKDGELTKDEVPTRMQQLVARHDTNKDGVLDKQELAVMSEQLAASIPEQGRVRGRGGFDGPPGGGGPRGGAGGGPPSPEQMIQDAFEFDANKDGQLSKSELQKFAETHAQRGGPGGGPGGGRGERGGPGGRDGGDRPTRPARPE